MAGRQHRQQVEVQLHGANFEGYSRRAIPFAQQSAVTDNLISQDRGSLVEHNQLDLRAGVRFQRLHQSQLSLQRRHSLQG